MFGAGTGLGRRVGSSAGSLDWSQETSWWGPHLNYTSDELYLMGQWLALTAINNGLPAR